MVRYWALVGPKGETVVCQLVQGSHGLQVQCGVSNSERVLRSSSVKTVTDGFNVAEAWRAGYVAQGWRTGDVG